MLERNRCFLPVFIIAGFIFPCYIGLGLARQIFLPSNPTPIYSPHLTYTTPSYIQQATMVAEDPTNIVEPTLEIITTVAVIHPDAEEKDKDTLSVSTRSSRSSNSSILSLTALLF